MTLRNFIGQNSIMRLSSIWVSDSYNAYSSERFLAKNGKGDYILFEVGGYENQSEGIKDNPNFLSDRDYLNYFLTHYPTLLEYTKFRLEKDVFHIESFIDLCNQEFSIDGLDKEVSEYTILTSEDVRNKLSEVESYGKTDNNINDYMRNRYDHLVNSKEKEEI